MNNSHSRYWQTHREVGTQSQGSLVDSPATEGTITMKNLKFVTTLLTSAMALTTLSTFTMGCLPEEDIGELSMPLTFVSEGGIIYELEASGVIYSEEDEQYFDFTGGDVFTQSLRSAHHTMEFEYTQMYTRASTGERTPIETTLVSVGDAATLDDDKRIEFAIYPGLQTVIDLVFSTSSDEELLSLEDNLDMNFSVFATSSGQVACGKTKEIHFVESSITSERINIYATDECEGSTTYINILNADGSFKEVYSIYDNQKDANGEYEEQLASVGYLLAGEQIELDCGGQPTINGCCSYRVEVTDRKP